MKSENQCLVKSLITAAALLAMNAVSAQTITSAFEGNWYDPNKDGQGFYFERYQDPQGRLGLSAIFVTYEDDGRPTFLTAGGLITKGKQNYPIYRPRIGQEISPGVFSPPIFTEVGKLELTFNSCSGATAKTSFFPGALTSLETGTVPSKIRVGTGSFGLRRLSTLTAAKRCTGGISDNTVPTDVPRLLDKTEQPGDFEIRTRYEIRPDASDLRLIFQYLPPGEYGIFSEDVELRRFRMTGQFPFTRGEARFRSPQIPNITSLLDFDPIGARLILRGLEVDNSQISRVLQLPSDALRPLQQIPNFGFPPLAVPVVVRETQATVTEAAFFRGITPERFKLRARLESAQGTAELRINIDGLPAGTYQIMIDGQVKGAVRSADDGFGDLVSETIFRSPTTAGSFPLDFTPLGSVVRVFGLNGVDVEVPLTSL